MQSPKYLGIVLLSRRRESHLVCRYSLILFVALQALIALGIVLPYVAKLDFFGKLPGDIRIKGENYSFYFPIATCIVLSVLLTLLGKFFFRK